MTNQPGTDGKEAYPNDVSPLFVGAHTIKVPAVVGNYLRSLACGQTPEVDGTRVWLQHKKNEYLLHIGDVDVTSLK
jgi:hypothetical protein